MKTIVLATGLALALGIGGVIAQTGTAPSIPGVTRGTQLTSAQCESIWQRADAAKSGVLTQAQAQAYVTDYSQADTNKDGKLTQAEFMSACQRGMVHDSATTGGSTGSSGSDGGSAVKK